MRERRDHRREPMAEADGIIEGRNAVLEALRAGTPVDKLYLARGETDAALGHIASTAREKGVVVVECDRRKLDAMSLTHAHQGVIAVAAVRAYASVEDILSAGYTQHAGENCISVEYTDGGVFGYTHRIYVSFNTGLLMGSETYDGDTLIYRMYSTIPDLNTPEENLFSPPDN